MDGPALLAERVDVDEELPRLGPAMLALPNDRWRQFVLLHIQRPRGFGGKNVIEAGFRPNSATAASVDANRLLNDNRIQEALREECVKQFTTLAPLAIKATWPPRVGFENSALAFVTFS